MENSDVDEVMCHL